MKTLEELIKENRWVTISRYEYLTEEFIEKYSDKVDWFLISLYQKLSEKFIEKHSDKFNENYLSHIIKYNDKYNECSKCNTKYYMLNYLTCNMAIMESVLK